MPVGPGQNNAGILTFPCLFYFKKVGKLKVLAGGMEIGCAEFSGLLPGDLGIFGAL